MNFNHINRIHNVIISQNGCLSSINEIADKTGLALQEVKEQLQHMEVMGLAQVVVIYNAPTYSKRPKPLLLVSTGDIQ